MDSGLRLFLATKGHFSRYLYVLKHIHNHRWAQRRCPLGSLSSSPLLQKLWSPALLLGNVLLLLPPLWQNFWKTPQEETMYLFAAHGFRVSSPWLWLYCSEAWLDCVVWKASGPMGSEAERRRSRIALQSQRLHFLPLSSASWKFHQLQTAPETTDQIVNLWPLGNIGEPNHNKGVIELHQFLTSNITSGIYHEESGSKQEVSWFSKQYP